MRGPSLSWLVLPPWPPWPSALPDPRPLQAFSAEEMGEGVDSRRWSNTEGRAVFPQFVSLTRGRMNRDAHIQHLARGIRLRPDRGQG